MLLDGPIKPRDFANDVVSGMTTYELMRKYRLSPEELQTLLKGTLEAEALLVPQPVEGTRVR